jgi:hypothetical protein
MKIYTRNILSIDSGIVVEKESNRIVVLSEPSPIFGDDAVFDPADNVYVVRIYAHIFEVLN